MTRSRRTWQQEPVSMTELAGLAGMTSPELEALHTLLAREHQSLTDRMIVPGTRAEPRLEIPDEQWDLMKGRSGEVDHMMEVIYREIARRAAER